MVGRGLATLTPTTEPRDDRCHSLPYGDVLFALWTNGAAVDDNPGVTANLTFPDLSAQKVEGIDVLNGFEQELVTSNRFA
jgi:hypothetical protein